MVKALLLENIHPLGTEVLHSAGVEVSTRSGALDEDELIDSLDGVQILGLRSKTHLTKRVLENAPDLLAAGAFCIGTNQIDLDAAAQTGVAVFNAPFSNTRSVVELALSEIIALTRRLTEKDQAMHAGRWDKSASGAHEVRGRTLGIVGYGFAPLRLPGDLDFPGMFHGVDERVPLEALDFGHRVLVDLLRSY